MNDFDSEVRERKVLARSARYRKNGSKSKNCPLPSDRLTKAQLKGLSGEVMTYNLNKPMTWADFKYMPADLQKEYLENLKANGATQKDAAEMLGVASNSLSKYCRSRNIQVFPHAGGCKSAAAEAK